MKRILWPAFLIFSLTISISLSFAIIVHPEPSQKAGSKETLWEDHETEESVSLLFTGDVMLGRYIATLRERNGGDFPFTYMPEVLEAIRTQLNVDELDLVLGNLEGPITDISYQSGKGISFIFDPEVGPLLKKVGFTTMLTANNHAFDQTREGFAKTQTYLTEAGLQGFGHPDTVNGEFSFLRQDFDTFSIGFLGLNDVDFKLDKEVTLAKIQELDSQVDVLIIGIHWGVEYVTTAPDWIQEFGHQMVDAGADFIWGQHPHVVQNREVYNGAPIYYSLGNFVFDQYWSQATQEGLVVGLHIQKNGEAAPVLTTTELMVDLVNQGEPKPRVPAN